MNRTIMPENVKRKGRRAREVRAAAVALLLGAASGCESLLDVELPGRVPAEALDNPAMAATLVGGAIADFECAFNEYGLFTAVFTDELLTSSGFTQYNRTDPRFLSIREIGAGGCSASSNDTNFGFYRPLQTARYQAEDAYARLSKWTDAQVTNRESLLAQAAAYAAYSLTLLGEGFCRMALDGGAEMTPKQVLEVAEKRFTTAIDHAAKSGNTAVRHMATLGRARVRLDLGRTADALADAKQIPANFVFNVERGTAIIARENRFFQSNNQTLHSSVDPAFRNLTVDGVPDPRVPVVSAGRNGNDGITPLWQQRKYASASAPVTLASWDEAQLIIAEIEGGQAAVAAINRLRDKVGLPRFSGTDPAAIRAQVIEERRRELFLEGHRINDLQRLKLPWYQGVNHKGEPYSELTCIPLPLVETDNNPNLKS